MVCAAEVNKMLNIEEAKIDAWAAIANLMGIQYFRDHFAGSCGAYPSEENDDTEYEYFMGFEGSEVTNQWTVFARVSVNRETSEVKFPDYKTPDGMRMESPIKPISFA